MRSGFSSGVFHIESRRLKQALTPKLEAALIQSKDLILRSFSRRCTEYKINLFCNFYTGLFLNIMKRGKYSVLYLNN